MQVKLKLGGVVGEGYCAAIATPAMSNLLLENSPPFQTASAKACVGNADGVAVNLHAKLIKYMKIGGKGACCYLLALSRRSRVVFFSESNLTFYRIRCVCSEFVEKHIYLGSSFSNLSLGPTFCLHTSICYEGLELKAAEII